MRRVAKLLQGIILLSALASVAQADVKPVTRYYTSGCTAVKVTEWTAGGKGRRPAVVLLHGGGGPELILNDPQYRRYPLALSEAGFTVLMPHYFGYTDHLAGDISKDEQRTLWVKVLKDAVTWARGRTDISPARIGVLGLSLGAYLGLRSASEDVRIAALAECYGWLPDTEAVRVNRMPPTLILHGAKDVLVDVAEAHRLERLFAERRISFETHIYPEQNHGFMNEDGDDSARRIIKFFRRWVK